MKKMLITFSFVLVMFGCNSKSKNKIEDPQDNISQKRKIEAQIKTPTLKEKYPKKLSKANFPKEFLKSIKLNMDPLEIVKTLGQPHAKGNTKVYSTYSNEEDINAIAWVYFFEDIQVQFFVQFETIIAYTFSIENVPKSKEFNINIHCLEINLGVTKLKDVEKSGWREYIVKHSLNDDRDPILKSKYKYARVCYGGGTVYYGNSRASKQMKALITYPVGAKEYPNIEDTWVDELTINSVTSSFNQYDSEHFGIISYN